MEESVYQNSEEQLVVNGEKYDKENIYQELKFDFNNNKSNKKNNYLIYVFVVLLIVCIYFFIHGDKPNKIREVSKSLDYVQVDGETVEVSDVKVKKIPQEVYDSMEIDPNVSQEIYSQANIDRSWEQYLLGDKKHILLITWDGCPYARKFRKELDDIFDKDSHFSHYYDKDIRDVGQHIELSCFDRNCASIWLLENCGEGICIINPIAKEIIIDNSQDSKQIFPLLEGYGERYNKSLIQ